MESMKTVHITDPLAWLDALARPDSLVALAAFAGSVVLSWCVVWLVRRAVRGSDLAALAPADQSPVQACHVVRSLRIRWRSGSRGSAVRRWRG